MFAKAAAHLENEIKIEKLGKKTNINAKLDFYLNGREGEIVRIDNFGNIITNLSSLSKNSYLIKTNKFNQKFNFYKIYDSAPLNKLFIIEGSYDTLEISLKNSSAHQKLRLKVGDRIIIQ